MNTYSKIDALVSHLRSKPGPLPATSEKGDFSGRHLVVLHLLSKMNEVSDTAESVGEVLGLNKRPMQQIIRSLERHGLIYARVLDADPRHVRRRLTEKAMQLLQRDHVVAQLRHALESMPDRDIDQLYIALPLHKETRGQVVNPCGHSCRHLVSHQGGLPYCQLFNHQPQPSVRSQLCRFAELR